MTGTTTNPSPSLPRRRVHSTTLWLAVGTVLGAAGATVVDADRELAASQPAPDVASASSAAAVVTVSADAAERWAIIELQARLDDCRATHYAADAIERCVGA